MPAGVRVETAKENADRSSEEIRDNLGFLRIFLLVFAFVALFVGAFLIFNTFSITVAQRVTEFGMLRTLGAIAPPDPHLGRGRGAGDRHARRPARHRRRLRRSPSGLNALFVAFGIDLPTTGLVTEGPHDRRLAADRRSSSPSSPRWSRRCARPGCRRSPPCSRSQPPRAVAGAWSSSRSRGAARRRRPGDAPRSGSSAAPRAATAAGLIGGGAVAIIFGVSLFSPRLVRPLASIAGWPLERLRRLTGRLARENTQRNPAAPRSPRRR